MTPPVNPCPCSASRMGPEPERRVPSPAPCPGLGHLWVDAPCHSWRPQGFSKLGHLPESPSVPRPRLHSSSCFHFMKKCSAVGTMLFKCRKSESLACPSRELLVWTCHSEPFWRELQADMPPGQAPWGPGLTEARPPDISTEGWRGRSCWPAVAKSQPAGG